MSEGYPENWKHAVVHFNPETKSMHFDRHFDSRSDEDIEIISGYVTRYERGRGTMIRSEVQRFAKEMEKQLQANEHKGGWEDCDSGFLMSELEKNFNALWRLQPSDKAGILRRATNIANFAMMIADNWGGLMEGGEQ